MLDLTHAKLIGQGTHKKCFIHPQNPSHCVKVAYNDLGQRDLNREVLYLKTRYRRKHVSTILPRFYGEVQTNFGRGYVVDYIRNADGTPCLNLQDWLETAEANPTLDPLINQAMQTLGRKMREEQVLCLAIYPGNILFQYNSIGEGYQPFLVNDLGNAARIPLAYWLSGVRLRSIDKRWQEFLVAAGQKCHPAKRSFIEHW